MYDIDDNNSPPAFIMIGRIGCSVLEELIEKNVSHSKMVIPIIDISSLEDAEMRYKFNKYPKGFEILTYMAVLTKKPSSTCLPKLNLGSE